MITRESLDFDIGTSVLSEYDPDKFLGVQVDVYGDPSATGCLPLELHSPYGFSSRPVDPDPSSGLGCQVLYAWKGDLGHAWLGQDPRFVPNLPQLKQGGSVQYGKTNSFHVIDGDNGSQTVYVPYSFGTPGDPTTATKAMAISIDVSNPGAESIVIVHGDGMAITMGGGGKHAVVIKNKSGDTCLVIDDDGYTVHSPATKVNGGLVVGDIVGAQPLVTYTNLAAIFTALGAALAAPGSGGYPAVAGILAGLLPTLTIKAA